VLVLNDAVMSCTSMEALTSLSTFCTLTCYIFSLSVSLKPINVEVYDVFIVACNRSLSENQSLSLQIFI